jgi:hypothetical protein
VLVIALLVVLDIIFILYNLWRRKEKGKLWETMLVLEI